MPSRAPTPRPTRMSTSTRALCAALMVAGALLAVRAARGDDGSDAGGTSLKSTAARGGDSGRRVGRAELSPLAARRLAGLDLSRRRIGAPAIVVTGIVLDPDGVPLAGVAVEARATGDVVGAPRPATSDGDGRFAIPVEVGYGGAVSGHVVARSGELVGTAPLYGSYPGEVNDLEIHLGRGLELVGVVTSGGLPLGGARVVAARVGSLRGEEAPEATARSAADGSFRVALYGAGVYSVHATMGAAQVVADRYVQLIDGGRVPEVAIELPPLVETQVVARRRDGSPLAGVKVRQAYDTEVLAFTDGDGVARYLASEGSQQRVTLERAGLAPVELDVPPGGAEAVLDPGSAIIGEVRADAIGVTELRVRQLGWFGSGYPHHTRLPGPGRFSVTVAPGKYEVVAHVQGAGEVTREVSVAAGETADLGRLVIEGLPARLDGVVLDGRGEPAAGVSVTVSSDSASSWQSATTDGRGRFHVERLGAGSYQVTAHVGGQSVVEAIEVAAGARLEVELVPAYDEEPEVAAAHDDEHGEYDAGEYDDGEYGDYEDEYVPQYTPAIRYEWADNGLVVTGPGWSDDGAAGLGDLLPGDVILSIDGRRFDEGGLVGGQGRVRLRVLRPATGRQFDTVVTRDQPFEEHGC
jgi:hypothetical protein